jgi:DNA-binding CsgD family transcriptional regulator
MLGSVRDFGREQLAAAGETGEVHELLLGWLAGRAGILLGRRGRAKDPDDWNWDLAALESYQYAASLACENADPRFGVLATAATVLLNDSGRSTEAQALAEHALDQPGLAPGDEARLLMAVTTSLALGGDQQVAVAVAERAYRSALSLGEDGLAFQARGALIYAIADSDPARSRLLVREQVAATGGPDQLADPLNDLAWTALIRGDLVAAEASAARLLALRGDALDLEERHTCGAIALAAGDHPRAAALFEEGVARATGTKILLDLVEGLGAAVTGSGDPGRGLRLLAGAASGRRRQGLRNHGWWAEQIGAAAAASRAALAGPAAAAAEAEGEAMSLDQLARYARSGEIDPPVPTSYPLTSREAAIARHVARGMTTRQIAARLGIGARVVDGSVARIRAKLGLASRAQLAAWAAEHLT